MKPNNELKQYLAESRKVWAHALKTGVVGFKFNEEQIPPETLADLWLNGHYFHDDEDKYDRLSKMMMGASAPFVRANFHQFIIEATRIIAYLGNFIDQGLKNEHFKF